MFEVVDGEIGEAQQLEDSPRLSSQGEGTSGWWIQHDCQANVKAPAVALRRHVTGGVRATLAAYHYNLQKTYYPTQFDHRHKPLSHHSNMASQSRRTEKTAMPKASPSPDATKSALLQTIDALLKKHDALSATEDTEFKDQLKTSITEGKTQLCDDLAAWEVTRRRNSEPERPEKETAAICGLIAAIDHELKAEERECWKDDGEIGPLQTALKTYAEVFGTSNANTNTRKHPWKPQMYTRMEENGMLFSFKSILANNL
jgi:hypothetical protein